MSKGWIGVDLDGTLAHYDRWVGPTHVGLPVATMVDRVKKWRASGIDVRIFTARVSSDGSDQRNREAALARGAIESWMAEHLGEVLPVTNVKDYAMTELWDDRVVQVEKNTGRVLGQRGLEGRD